MTTLSALLRRLRLQQCHHRLRMTLVNASELLASSCHPLFLISVQMMLMPTMGKLHQCSQGCLQYFCTARQGGRVPRCDCRVTLETQTWTTVRAAVCNHERCVPLHHSCNICLMEKAPWPVLTGPVETAMEGEFGP
jgi:hypothetical protein